MELLEYKMDANDWGNEITPNWINKSDCGYFYNPANYTYVGLRLSPRVKVPDSVTVLSKAQLLTRCQIPGVMMKSVDDVLTQMTNEEIEAEINDFCNIRGIA